MDIVQSAEEALLDDANAIARSSSEIHTTADALKILDHQSTMDELSARLQRESPDIYAGVLHVGDGGESILMIKGTDTTAAVGLDAELSYHVHSVPSQRRVISA